ncbi:MAG: TIGR02996 domain-containing protein [Myxococcales bacterium]|nr:TIGR02996 domain-containing protein [Myxococcales bacterium]
MDAAQFLEAIYADPAADGPRLVYADWLMERGDRLGEFIALQIARKTKGKRTMAKERALLVAEGAGFWKDHPCVRFGAPSWEDTARGFPARFRVGRPVSEEPLREQGAALAETKGNPGWSTVESLYLPYEITTEPLAALLRDSDFRSLREIDGMNVQLLDRLASAPLAVANLELWVREDRDLPVVGGWPALRRLVVDMRATVPRVMAAVAPSTLAERLSHLELRGVATHVAFEDALPAFARLSPAIDTFAINEFYGQYTQLSGDRARPDLSIGVTAHQIERVVEALARLPVDAVATLKIEFASGGFFTKKSRPVLAESVTRATVKWGDRVTLAL